MMFILFLLCFFVLLPGSMAFVFFWWPGFPIRIVTNGEDFAVEQGFWVFKMYADFYNVGTWCTRHDPLFYRCWSDETKAEHVLKKLKRQNPSAIKPVDDEISLGERDD